MSYSLALARRVSYYAATEMAIIGVRLAQPEILGFHLGATWLKIIAVAFSPTPAASFHALIRLTINFQSHLRVLPVLSV
jgi:hypothetical protein